MNQRKRSRVDQDSDDSGEEICSCSCTHIQDLPNNLFQYCLEFVGKGNFDFVAPVSKFFYWNYISQGVQMKNNVLDVDAVLQQGRNKYTSAKVIGSGSIGQATHCFLNAPEKFWNAVCCEAAMNGRRDILECAESIVIMDWSSTFDNVHGGVPALEKVVANRDLDIIEFLKSRLDIFQHWKFVSTLLDKGQVLDVHWMIENQIIDRDLDTRYDKELAKHGHLEILEKDLLQKKCELNHSHLMEAAEGGQVEVFKWLLIQDIYCPWDLRLFCHAATGGSIAILQLCVENDCPSDAILYRNVMTGKANKSKAVDALKLLKKYNVPWDEWTCFYAARMGNLEALKWAKSNGCPWNIETFQAAVKSSDIEILEYCFKNGCPFDSSLYESVYEDKDLPQIEFKIFKWLHEHGIPWGDKTGNKAAQFHNLSTLVWALKNGCPWNDNIFDLAIIRSVNIGLLLSYCIEKNHLPSKQNVYNIAIEHPNFLSDRAIQIMEIFRQYEISMDESVIDCAIRSRSLRVLRWLRCNGCPCRPDQQHHLEALDS
ncbi:hypothetical protein CTEN210_16818 [Chaetoceros tenuissimus]|uniref:Uncharacterized protein n=1 Tax=Chaetoceros tenuissimus TaxID=426638 RepID=A0AAD3D9E5_9STRA|nr:hypothetical protein CTEN210_16818 [Chaetoceros tenuissimus]